MKITSCAISPEVIKVNSKEAQSNIASVESQNTGVQSTDFSRVLFVLGRPNSDLVRNQKKPN